MPVYSSSEEKALHTRAVRANSRDLGMEILSRSDVLLESTAIVSAYEQEVAQLPKEVVAGFYYIPKTFRTFAQSNLPSMTIKELLDELNTKWSRPIRPYNMKDGRLLYFCEERVDEQKRNWVKRNVVFMSNGEQ